MFFRVAWRSWLLKVPPSSCSVLSVGKYTELGPELDPSQEPYPIQFSIYLFLDIPTPGWCVVYNIFWRIIQEGGGWKFYLIFDTSHNKYISPYKSCFFTTSAKKNSEKNSPYLGGGGLLLVNADEFIKWIISGHFSLHLILQRAFRWFFLSLSFYIY